MFCNKCGKEIEEAAKFCPYCGEKNVDLENEPKPTPEKMRKKQIGMIAVAAVIISLTGCLVFLIIQLCSKTPAKQTASEEQEATTESVAAMEETIDTEQAGIEQEAETDSLETRIEPWKELYCDFIRQESNDYQRLFLGYDAGVEYDDDLYVYQYGLAYMDEDDVPELVIQYIYPFEGWVTRIYACIGDTVTPLYDGGEMFDIQYVEKTGKLRITNMGTHMYRDSWYYNYSAGQLTEVFSACIGDDDGFFDNLENVDSIYIDDTPVSVAEFQSKLQEEGFSPMRDVILMEISEENVNSSFGATCIYTNTEFGYSLLIPIAFTISEEETGNGGPIFYNDAGGCITAFGYLNDKSDTPESIVNGYAEASYTYAGDNYCCVSYIEGTDIIYKAYRIDSNLVYGFEISYPQEDKEKYDGIVNDMLHYLVNE